MEFVPGVHQFGARDGPPELVTVKLYVVGLTTEPPVPVTVIGLVPVGVDPEVKIVNVDVHVGLQLTGLNEQDAPDGRFEQLKLTVCDVPETKVVVTSVLVELPCATLPEVGLTAIEKSKGTLVTVRTYVVGLVNAPAVPVTVIE